MDNLSVHMERTRLALVQAVNGVLNESKLPAYLLEGIVEGILADIRRQKNAELVAALQQSADKTDDKEASDGNAPV